MVSSPHTLVSSMKGGEQILSSADRGDAESARLPTSHPEPASWDRPTPRGPPSMPLALPI